MTLHPPTLLLTATAVTLFFIGAFALVAWRARADERSMLWHWTAGLGLQCAAFLTLTSVLWWPGPATGILGNVMMLLGYIAFLRALRAYFGSPVSRRRDLVLLAIFVLLVTAFTAIWPIHTPRFAFAALCMLFVLGESITVLLRHAKRPLDVSVVLTLTPFAVIAILMLTRLASEASAGWRIDPPLSLPLLTQLQSFGMLVMPLLGTLGFALMVHARLAAALEHLANHDPLTGLANRRRFDAMAKTAFDRARQQRTDLALLAIDADHFKAVNDTMGHQGGDAVLRALADRLQAALPRMALLARTGGEEFSALLPGANAADALVMAELLRETIAAQALGVEGGARSLSISVGVALRSSDDADWEALARRADRSLYAAKHAGRNRVLLAS